MSKPVKIIAILVGIVVALIVLAVIALVIFVDPNRYRDDIIGAVKTHTGRDFQIEGKLKLSFFPWLGLETQALQLANAPGFGREPFARVESAAIKVELLPLLRKELRVDAIRLNGLALNRAKQKDGRTNWDDLTKAQAKPADAETPKSPKAGAPLAAFAVNEISVRNANIVWNDQQSGARYAVRGLDLTSANILGNTPAPIKLAFDLETGKPPVRNRIQLDARANVDLAKQALNVPELTLNAGPLTLKGAVTGAQLETTPKFDGRLEVARFNARDLLKQLGIAYAPADPKALTGVGLSTKFNATTASAALNQLALTLDDTRLTGSLSLASFAPLMPRFDLALDRIDVDRYLPAPAEGKGETQANKNAAAAPVVIPLALLREVDTQGKLKVQALKAFGIQSQDIAIQVNARGGKINLGPNSAKLYGGSYSGRTAIDASGKAPRFQFNEKLTNVQIGPFLKDADVFDRYSGTGNVELNLSGQGLDGPSVTRTLNGTAAIALRDGKVQGVNLQKLVNDARAAYDKLRGKDVTANPQPSDETAFQSLTANIKVTNGVARNDDLKLVGPVVRAEGQGNADLVQEKIDYRLRVTLSEGAERKGTTVPVTISGPFASPKYGVDVGALFKEQTGESLQKKRESIEQKLEDKLRKKLKR